MSIAGGALSATDRGILKILLAVSGKPGLHSGPSPSSDEIIASELGVSLASVRRRRKVLEKNFLDLLYVMNLRPLGYRRVDFLISTQKGLAGIIANDLLKVKAVVRVGQSVGQPTIDVRAELIIKDNGELLELLEEVKSMDGVRDVVWSEVVKVVGDKGSVPADIIDGL